MNSHLALLTDFYQLTMMQGYYLKGFANKEVVFDLFYRQNPFGNGYAVAAGLQQIIEYIDGLQFSEEDISYLRGQGTFCDEFLNYLRDFRFTGHIAAVPEGTVIFPHEPLVRVRAPIIQAQCIETALLNIFNHQSLIATKAARIVYAAKGDRILEFGLRRAQGPDAGIYGSRAAIIGGCVATSNVLAGKKFDIPIRGTHAHSWVMSFPTELEAFRAYAQIAPTACVLLVDTYDTIKSGIPNAIKVFKEMRQQGLTLSNYGIRLDSGDLAYLTKQAREMLNNAGFSDAIISASGDIDEYILSDLKLQGAQIEAWGVGTKLITAEGSPSFGGVYKLAAEVSHDGRVVPKIKLSENIEKLTNPGVKKVCRIYDNKSGKIKADLIALEEESFDTTEDLTLFHPLATWKKMKLSANTYSIKELLIPVFVGGECVYNSPSVMQIQKYCAQELNTLWDEHKRLRKPQLFPVDLSLALWTLKSNMIQEIRGE